MPKITSPKIEAYIESRVEERAAYATINRELSALKRMLNLGARQTPPKVDRDNDIVRLDPGETKNDDGRTVYLDDELQETFNHQWELRRRSLKLTPYVFPNMDGTCHIIDFKGSWKTACKDAKIGKRLFHNFKHSPRFRH